MPDKPTYEELEQKVKELEEEISNRKDSKKKLKESQERLISFIAASPDGFILFDSKLNHVEMNKSALEISGLGRKEVIGKNILDVIPNIKDTGHYDEYKKVIKTGVPFLTPHAEFGNKNIELKAFKAGDGLGMIFTDITERVQNERALRNAEGYRQLFNTVTDTIVLFDSKTRKFLDVNDAALELYGYSKEEFLNLTHWDITTEPEESDRTIKQTLHGEITRIPLRYHKKKDGTEFPVEISTGAMKLGDKNILCGAIRDITDRKIMEENYRLLIDNSNAAITFFDKNGTFLLLNTIAAKWLGGKPEDFINKTLFELFPKDFAEMRLEKIQKVIQSGFGEKSEGMVEPLNRYICSNLQPVKNNDGKVMGAQVVSYDITEQKQKEKEKHLLEIQLQRVEIQLQRAQKLESIGSLAGGIAHNFNNILSSVIGYAQLGLDDLKDSTMLKKNLEGVLNAAFRAQNLIRQIITFSRPIKDGYKPILISPVIKETLKFLKAFLPSTIEIRRYLEVEREVIIANASQIHEVVMNLCVNSFQAMREKGGKLKVTLTNTEYDPVFMDPYTDVKPGSYLKLSVSDNGPGIPPEQIEKIFDPHFTTKNERHGSGLGLSVVRRIVDEHGGAIQVDSKVGEGTSFNVYFPVSETEMLENENIFELPASGKETILFVDDEQTVLFCASRMLENLGYVITTCQKSTKALDLFQSQPDRFDMVITDMTMPLMTGDKLAKELLKIRPDIPIILCTGHSSLISEKKALAMGIKAFILKPLIKQKLATAVRKALDEK